MTRPDALDYSWGRPSPAALKAAGIRMVARYLSHDATKDLSIAEAAALHAAGIGVLLNWESDAGRPLLGAAAGTADGRDAAARAESRGAPHGLTIYYSTDRDTQPSQWPTIAAYYRAAGQATAGRYKVGVYGEADLIDYLHKQGVVTSEWQTYAWSNGRLSAEADLYQYLNGQTIGGAPVDFNRIIHPALLGAWWPNGETPLGGGVPLTPLEVFMSELTAVEQRNLYNRVMGTSPTGNAILNDLTVDQRTEAAVNALPTNAELAAALKPILDALAAVLAKLPPSIGGGAGASIADIKQAFTDVINKSNLHVGA